MICASSTSPDFNAEFARIRLQSPTVNNCRETRLITGPPATVSVQLQPPGSTRFDDGDRHVDGASTGGFLEGFRGMTISLIPLGAE